MRVFSWARDHASGAAAPRRPLRALSWLVLLLPSFAQAQSQWITDLETGALYNSNLGNATAGPDVHGAFGLTASVATGPFYELSPGTTAVIAAQAKEIAFGTYANEDNLALGLTARLDHKFGLGRQAPHVFLAGSEVHLQFRDGLRSGWLGTLTAGARSMFGERLVLRGEMALERRSGNDGPPIRAGFPANVFDQSNRQWTVGADYSLSDAWLLQAALGLRRGDTDYVETTTPADPFDGDTAGTRDPTFGPSAYVVKTQVRSVLVDVGASWALGEHASLNLIFRRQLTVDTTGTLYTRSVPTLSYQYRFD